MRPGSYNRPEQALEVSARDTDQGLGDDSLEAYEDAPDIVPTICGTVEDSNSETLQVGSHAYTGCGMQYLTRSRVC